MSELPQGPTVRLAGVRERFEPAFDEDAPPPEGMAIPAGCLRRLQLQGIGCQHDCPGRQRDGGCAADLVRGMESWQFDIDIDGFWVLI